MIVPPLIAACHAKWNGHETRFVWCHILLMGMCYVYFATVCNEFSLTGSFDEFLGKTLATINCYFILM